MGRGGKTLFFKQLFQVALQRGLVAFDGQQIVAPALKEDLLGRLILGVQGIGDQDLAQQILPAQQLAGGGDLVAFGVGDDTAQKAALGIDGVDNLHPGVAHLLAIEDDDPILPRSQDLILPAD